MTNQSQKSGFQIENEIKTKAFQLPASKNDTGIHDIPKDKNIFDPTENISIKSTGSKTICLGDARRIYSYDFRDKHTMVVYEYKQDNEYKKLKYIYEIDFNKKCHDLLFGDLPKEELDDYVRNVKSIPRKTKGKDAKRIFDYLNERDKLKEKYDFKIQINPKVDSSQSRVQCSIPNFTETLKDYIIYKSNPDAPNMLRGREIISHIKSNKRVRNNKLK